MPTAHDPSTPIYFPSAAAFGDWLRAHHETASELLVGYWKTATGRPTMTWSASVDEALCYGWIDGIRRSVDAERYTIRFTPRRRGSTWSAVNVKKAQALIAAGRMAPAGFAAWRARDEGKTAIYAYERATAALSPDEVGAFKARRAAWQWFEAQPAGYRRLVTHWVTSAKRPDTRARRLATLIDDAAHGRRIAQLRREPGPSTS